MKIKRLYCVVLVLATGSTVIASGLFSENVAHQSLNVIGAPHQAASVATIKKRSQETSASPITVSSLQANKLLNPNARSEQASSSSSSADNFTVSSDKIMQTEAKVAMTAQIQKSNQQLMTLGQRVQTLEKRVQSLSKAFGLINVQLQQLKLKPASQPKVVKVYVVPKGFWAHLSQYLATVPAYTLLGVNAILLLIIVAMLVRRPKPLMTESPDEHTTPPDEDTDQEYDFMGTKEAVPAKLDLARAYVAMQDYEQANTVLQEVLSQGTSKQKQEAQDILNSIPGGK